MKFCTHNAVVKYAMAVRATLPHARPDHLSAIHFALIRSLMDSPSSVVLSLLTVT